MTLLGLLRTAEGPRGVRALRHCTVVDTLSAFTQAGVLQRYADGLPHGGRSGAASKKPMVRDKT